ncbi:MAG: 50S ribosomal protein L11 methyltransferase, partial [Flavobacteriales bacterium]|nr:50S ribosomal protein L11 methyltransferase [Flavobacteriales bacterium]
AILAEKKGAQRVLATDIEDFIVDNARSNVRHNACVNIRVDKADLTEMKPGEYGLILANINLNTLTQNLSVIRSLAAEGADIVLSGFYNTDAHGLIMQSESDGMRLVHKKTHDNWSALRFKYSASH